MIRILIMLITVIFATHSHADMMRMAVTTSFNNSGLSEKLLPAIQSDLGLEVQLLIVGTGQAIRLGEAGDVDAILVHSQKAEEAFIAAGYGTHRREIMYNDFVIIGPADDPANILDAHSAAEALRAVATSQSLFEVAATTVELTKRNSRFGPLQGSRMRILVHGIARWVREWAHP